MNTFQYHRPSTVADAVALLESAEDAKALSGGQSFLPVVKLGLAQPSDIVDLKGLDALRGVSRDGDRLVIGAAMTHAEVNGSDDVRAAIPAIADLAGLIGDAQVRNRGTMGGSLAHADPRADYPGAVMGCDGVIHTNARTIDAEDFWHGLFMTELEEDEIITKVSFRVPSQAAYAKFPHPASKYPVAGVFVAKYDDGVRVAVTGAGQAAFRVPQLEAALNADFSPDAVKGVTVSADDLQDDSDFSAAYRANLIVVMCRRAVAAAGSD